MKRMITSYKKNKMFYLIVDFPVPIIELLRFLKPYQIVGIII